MQRFQWMLLSVAAAFAAGCDFGTYGDRFEQRLDELQKKSAFVALLDSARKDIPDPNNKSVGVTLQIPKFLAEKQSSGEQAAVQRLDSKNESGLKIDPARAMPPFLNISGFYLSYELLVEVNQTQKLPLYCYLWVVNVASHPLETLMPEIEQQIKADLKEVSSWESASAVTPEGGNIDYQHLSASGEQMFDSTMVGGEKKKLPGQFELWLHKNDRFTVIVAWRYPDEIAGKLPILDSARAMLGTLKIDESVPYPPVEEPAPEEGEPANDAPAEAAADGNA